MSADTATAGREPVPEGMKRCPSCGAVRDLGDFTRNRRAKDGRADVCSACNAARCASYQARIYAEALAAYGDGRCECCGTGRAVVLMLVTAGPAEAAGGGAGGGFPKAFRLRQQGWPAGWRVLCANCRLAGTRAGRCDCSDDGSAAAALRSQSQLLKTCACPGRSDLPVPAWYPVRLAAPCVSARPGKRRVRLACAPWEREQV